MIADGHIHTPFCPHGTSDQIEEYVEWFIKHEVEEISFTEHAPFPIGFIDSTPTKDSSMSINQLPKYIEQLQLIKHKYHDKIKINIGLEVDYIEGFETDTTELLNEIGPLLDDSILSVHFIKNFEDYYCIDYSEDYFNEIVNIYGSVSAVYEKYYETVKKSITSNLGTYKPKRIGHLTLAHKFQLKFPPERHFRHEEEALLPLIQQRKLGLDYNGAGIAKKYCLESYPPDYIIEKAINLGIPLIYGSDAHRVKDLGQGYKNLNNKSILSKPSILNL